MRIQPVQAPALLAVLAACASSVPPPAQLEHRLVYALANPGVARQRAELLTVLRRARSHGYDGVVLNDFRASILEHVGADYVEGLRTFRSEAESLGIEVIPSTGPFGWSEAMLYNDPNLVEAMPVRGQPLVVEGGEAGLDSANLLRDPGFEDVEGGRFAQWDLMDRPGVAVHVGERTRSGARSMLVHEIPEDWRGKVKARVMQRVEVRPWTQYRASMWVKTEDFTASWAIRLFGAVGRGLLSDDELRVPPTQDWTRYDVLLNSRDNDRLELYAGVWAGGSGRMWIDDLRLEETAFVNLVRREGAGLVVSDADGTVYEEGRDFERLVDPLMGRNGAPGRFDRWHQPPSLRIVPGSRIRDGDELLVDYSHAVTAKDKQATVCLDHPRVYELFEREVRALVEIYRPRALLVAHDEILVAGWCGSCRREGRTAGALLAESLRRCAEIARRVDPGIELWFWNDMVDPHHNAVPRFSLINGDLAGSWTGLPRDAVILNWNRTPRRPQSLRFFASLGLRQVLAGYYEGRDPAIRKQLAAPGLGSSIRGVMYATFTKDFSRLEEFAEQAWGRAGEVGPALARSP